MKLQNHRTEASCQSAAEKVLYKYPNISQNGLSSDPRHFDNFWSIKLKLRRCTSAINILSLCEVAEPYDNGFMPKCRGQTTASQC